MNYFLSLIIMNCLITASPGGGKSMLAAREALEWNGPLIVIDPHRDSLAKKVLTHITGNVLYEKLSDVVHTLGWDFLIPSDHPNPAVRKMENDWQAGVFVDILLRQSNMDSLGAQPLKQQWTMRVIQLYLQQNRRWPLTILPFALRPNTTKFDQLLEHCTNPDLAELFDQLRRLTPRSLRSEIGSALRLLESVCESAAFAIRARGGFNFEEFLQNNGKLIVERGDEISEDAMRVMMTAINIRTINHAKRRKAPFPPIRLYIDEATNFGLVGRPEARALAETRKFGLFFSLLVQAHNFPAGTEDLILQASLRKVWGLCSNYDIARKGAQGLVAASRFDDESSFASRVASMTNDLMNLKPGWFWIQDPAGVRKQYVELLEDPWVWPKLQELKLRQKIAQIHARPEYGLSSTEESASSSMNIPAQQDSSLRSSPAERWKRGTNQQRGS